MNITNFPFANDTATNNYGVVSFTYHQNISLTAGNYLTGAYIPPGSISGIISQSPTGGGAASAVSLDTNAQIMFTVTYNVA